MPHDDDDYGDDDRFRHRRWGGLGSLWDSVTEGWYNFTWFIRRPFYALADWFSSLFERISWATRHRAEATRAILTSPLWALRYLGWSLVRPFTEISWRDNAWYLIQGVPALLIGVTITAVTIAAVAHQTGSLTETYRQEAHALRRKGDDFKRQEKEEEAKQAYQEARMLYERLVATRQHDLETREALAETLEALGEISFATSLMQDLAEKRHFKAQIWMANWLLNNEPYNPNSESWNKAVEYLRRAVEVDPDDRVVNFLLARIYLARGKIQLAKTYLQKIVAFMPHLRFNLAQIYLAEGKTDEARQEYENAVTALQQIVKERPNYREARLLLVDGLMHLGRYQEAMTTLEEALSFDAHFTEFKLRQAKICIEWANAKRAFNRDGAGLDEARRTSLYAVKILQGITSENPENLEAVALLANVLVHQLDNWEIAEPYLRRLAEEHPFHRLNLLRLLVRQNRKYEANDQFETIRQKLEQDIRFNPTDLASRKILADAFLAMDQVDQAESLIMQGLQVDEQNTILRESMAQICSLRASRLTEPEDLSKKLALINRALEFAPNDEKAQLQLAEICALEPSAVDDAIKLIERQMLEGRHTAVTYLVLGMLFMQQQEMNNAIIYFDLARKSNPGMDNAINNFCWIAKDRENADLPMLIRTMTEILNRPQSRHNGLYRDTRGHLYKKAAMWKEALADFLEANRSMPNDPSISRSIAECYERLGEANLAAQFRARADQLDTTSQQIVAEEKLDKLPSTAKVEDLVQESIPEHLVTPEELQAERTKVEADLSRLNEEFAENARKLNERNSDPDVPRDQILPLRERADYLRDEIRAGKMKIQNISKRLDAMATSAQASPPADGNREKPVEEDL